MSEFNCRIGKQTPRAQHPYFVALAAKRVLEAELAKAPRFPSGYTPIWPSDFRVIPGNQEPIPWWVNRPELFKVTC